jgi:hypothetical protein
MIGYGAIGTGLLLLLLAVQLFRDAYAVRAEAAGEVPAAAAEEARPAPPAPARKRGRSESAQIDLHPRKLEEGEEFAIPTRLTSADPLLRPLAPA